jgi:hypothetical protein
MSFSALRIVADCIGHLHLQPRLGGLGPRQETPKRRTRQRCEDRGLSNVAGGQGADAPGDFVVAPLVSRILRDAISVLLNHHVYIADALRPPPADVKRVSFYAADRG